MSKSYELEEMINAMYRCIPTAKFFIVVILILFATIPAESGTNFKPPLDLSWKLESGWFHTIDVSYENGTLYQFGTPPGLDSNMTVRAIDKAGKIKWQKVGIVAISDNLGITGDRLVALDMETGAELWNERLGSGTEYSLVVDNGTAYVGASDGIVAFNIRDRTVKWKFNREINESSGVNLEKKDDILYASINTFKVSIDKAESPPKVVAINAANGTLLWDQEIGAVEINTLPPSPTVGKDKLYIVTLKSKTVYAFDRSNGSIIWTSTVPIHVTPESHVLKIPLYKDKLYVGDLWGWQVYALDANTGKTIWNTDLLTALSESNSYSGNNTLFKYLDLFLHPGSNSHSASISNSPVVYNDVVYIGVSESGRSPDLYALDLNDGKLIWTYIIEKNWTLNFLVIGDDMLFAVMETGDVYAFSPRSPKTAGFGAVLGLFGLLAIFAYKKRRKLK